MTHTFRPRQQPAWIRALSAMLAASMAVLPVAPVRALPRGEQVRNGDVQFQRQGNELLVTQGSARAIVHYDAFSIGASEAVRFAQPGASAAILNRVVGAERSDIAGSLSANGQVYLVNPNGILFAPSADVNVGQLVASGLNMADEDFLSGRLLFRGGSGSVVNQGSIRANAAFLIGGAVENTGRIAAGDVVLAAGRESVLIEKLPGGSIRVVIDGETQDVAGDDTGLAGEGPVIGGEGFNAAGEPLVPTPVTPASALADLGDVVNSGDIDASGLAGGNVNLHGTRILHSGAINADASESAGGNILFRASQDLAVLPDSLLSANGGRVGDGGNITLIADGTAVVQAGARIQARGGSEQGDGGNVEFSGHRRLAWSAPADLSAAHGRKGTVLLDPVNVDIVATSVPLPGPNATTNGVWNVLIGSSAWGATNTPSQIHVNDLRNQLLSGNVEIRSTLDLAATIPDPGQAGNIRFLGTLDASGLAGATELHLNADMTTGSIEFNGGGIVNGSANLDLRLTTGTGGSISQSGPGGLIEVSDLSFTSDGTVNLANGGNQIARVQGTAAGAVTIVDGADGLEVFGAGLDSTSQDIQLTTDGDLTLSAEVNAGTSDLFLTSVSGNIGQSAKAIADALSFSAASLVTLDHADNQFASASGNAGGALTLADADALSLGAVSIGTHALSVTTGGALTVNDSLGSPSATGITLGGSTITFTAVGNQSIDAGTGSLLLQGPARKTTAGDLDLSGLSGITAEDDLAVDLGRLTLNHDATLGGNTGANGISAKNLIFSAAGDQSMRATAGSLAIQGTASKATGNLTLGGSAGIGVTNNLTVATGNLVLENDATLGGNTSANGISAKNLIFSAAGDQSMRATAGSLAIQGIASKATGNLTLGGTTGIGVTNNLTVTAGNLLLENNATLGGDTSANGIITQALAFNGVGDQGVNAGAGSLLVQGSARKTTAGNLALSGGTALTVTNDLTVDAGNLTLNHDATLGGNTSANGISAKNLIFSAAGDQSMRATAGSLDIQGTASKATGNLTLGGSAGIGVTNNLTVATGNLVLENNATLGGNTSANGITTKGLTFSAAGDQSMRATAGSLAIQGTASKATGNLTLGGTTGIGVTNNLTVTAGNLLLENDATLGGDTSANGITTQALAFNGVGDQGVNAGAGSLLVQGSARKTTAGNLALSGGTALTVTNDLTVDAGNLTLNHDATLGGNTSANGISAKNLIFSAAGDQSMRATAGSLAIQGTASKATGNLTLGGTTGIGVTNNLTVATGNLVLENDATLGDNTSANGITTKGLTFSAAGDQSMRATAGSLAIQGTASKATGNLTLGGTTGIGVTNNLTVTAGNLLLENNATLGGNTSANGITTQALAFNGVGDQGVNAGAGSLLVQGSARKTTAGNLALSGGTALTVTNDLTVDAGNLTLNHDATLGGNTSANGISAKNLIFSAAGDQSMRATAGSLAIQGTASKATGNLTLGGTTGIGVTNNLTVTAGNLLLENNATLGGDTSANGITTQALAFNGVGDQGVNAGAGSLLVQGTTRKTTAGNLALSGGTALTVTNDLTVDAGNLTLNHDATLGGNTSANGISAKNLIFSAAGDQSMRATAGSLDIQGTASKATGNLTLGGSAGIGVTNNLTVATGNLVLENNATLGGNTSANGITTKGLTFSAAGDQSMRATAGSLAIQGTASKATGNLTLGGTTGIGVTNNLTVTAGNLLLENDATLGGDTSANGITTQALAFNGVGDQGVNAGAGSLLVQGSARKTTAGNLALSGGTALTVTNDLTVDAGNLTLNHDATLGGNTRANGIITQALTFNGVGDQAMNAGAGSLLVQGTARKTSAGDLALSGASGITVEDDLTVNSGSVALLANATMGGNIQFTGNGTFDHSITFNNAGDQSLRTAGNIAQNAGVRKTIAGELLVHSTGGGITMASMATTSNLVGNIRYRANTDITLGLVDAGANDVFLDAGGNLLDAQGDTVGHGLDGFATTSGSARAVNIAGDELVLSAGGTVGAVGNPIDTRVRLLNGVSTNQSIYVFEDDDLLLDTLRAEKHVKVETLAGGLTLSNQVIAATGDVLLAAGGSNSDVVVKDFASISAATNLSLRAERDLVLGSSTITTGRSLDLAARTGTITRSTALSATHLGIEVGADLHLNQLTATDLVVKSNGGIYDGNGTTNNLTVTNLVLVAGKGIGTPSKALDLDVVNLAATASNGIFLAENNDIMVTQVEARVNRVHLDSTTTNLGQRVSGLNTLTTGADGHIVLTTRDGFVRILDGNTNGVGVVVQGSGNILLDANGVGKNLEVHADVRTAGGHISLAADQDVILGSNPQTNNAVEVWTSGTGTVDLLAGRTVDMFGGDASRSHSLVIGADDIRIQAIAGDVKLARVQTTGAGRTIVVDAGQNILDANDGLAANTLNLSSTNLYLRAGSGTVGQDANALDIQVGSALVGRAAQGIYIHEQDDISIDSLTQTRVRRVGVDGDVTNLPSLTAADLATTANGPIKLVTTAGSIWVKDGDTNGLGVVAHGTGDILLDARGVGHDLYIHADVRSTTGNISLSATRDVKLNFNPSMPNQGVDVATTGTGTIDILAGSNVRMNGGSATNAQAQVLGADNIRIQAQTNSVYLALAQTTGSGKSIEVYAGQNIVDANDVLVADNLNLDASGVVMQAAQGKIGDSDPNTNRAAGVNWNAIDTKATKLAATSATGIYIRETDDVAVDLVPTGIVRRVNFNSTPSILPGNAAADLTTMNNGPIKLVSAAGSIRVNDGDTNGKGVVANGTGDILLDARGTNSTLVLNSAVISGTGHISLAAGEDVNANDLVSTGGTGTIDVLAGRDVVMKNGATPALDAKIQGQSHVRMDAGRDIKLAQVETTTGVTNTLFLVAGGNILDNNDSGVGKTNTLNLVASRVRLSAGGFIGGADISNTNATENTASLDVRASTLAASASQGIYVRAQSDVSVDSVAAAAVNRVNFRSDTVGVSDAAALSDLTTGNGPVKLVAADGSITVNDGADADGAGVTAGGAGHVLLDARGANSDLNLNANVASTTGHLDLKAGRDVIQQARVQTSGTIHQEARGGSIRQGAFAVTESLGNTVRLKAQEDILVASVRSSADVSLVAGKNVVDTGVGTEAVRADGLRLQADRVVGTANGQTSHFFRIDANRVAGTMRTSSAQVLDLNNLTVGDVGDVVVNEVNFRSTLADITDVLLSGVVAGNEVCIGANGDLTVARSISAAGSAISLIADADMSRDGNLLVESGVDLEGSMAWLAGVNVSQSGGSSIRAGGGRVAAVADGLLQLNGTIQGGEGAFSAGGSVEINGLVTLGGTGGVRAESGSITGRGTINARSLALEAGRSIGSSADLLDVGVDRLGAKAGTGGLHLNSLRTTSLEQVAPPAIGATACAQLYNRHSSPTTRSVEQAQAGGDMELVVGGDLTGLLVQAGGDARVDVAGDTDVEQIDIGDDLELTTGGALDFDEITAGSVDARAGGRVGVSKISAGSVKLAGSSLVNDGSFIRAGTVDLSARGGAIGADNSRIRADTGTLGASARQSIYLDLVRDVNVGLNTLRSDDGDINIHAQRGLVDANGSGLNLAARNVRLAVNGTIGEITDPLEVQIKDGIYLTDLSRGKLNANVGDTDTAIREGRGPYAYAMFEGTVGDRPIVYTGGNHDIPFIGVIIDPVLGVNVSLVPDEIRKELESNLTYTDELIGYKFKNSVFGDFYFLHTKLAVSDLADDLDTNSLDYLLDGLLHVTPDPNSKLPSVSPIRVGPQN